MAKSVLASPLVSVVIPTYNRAGVLTRSIGSVLAQSESDLEVIIVDDASTDGTERMVAAIEDPRIRYIRHDRSQGGAAARNTGIRAARGRYIAFQDSDDEWLPEKLERQMQKFRSGADAVDIVYTGFLRRGHQSEVYIPEPHVKVREGDILAQLLRGNFVSTQTILVKRDSLEKVGLFDERLPRFQDWELVIRLAETYQFHLVDEPLVLVHETPGNITSDEWAGIVAMATILEKHRPVFARDPVALADYLCALGHLESFNGAISRGRRHLLEALKIRPQSLRAWRALALGMLGSKVYRHMVIAGRGMRALGHKD